MSLFDRVFRKSQAAPSATPISSAITAQSLYEKAERLMESGQKREAIETLAEAVDTDPRCIDACIGLARVFHAIDPVEHADIMIKYAEQAYEIDPTNPRAANIASVARFARGKTHWHQEQWQDAYECFKLSLIYDPDDPQAFAALDHVSKKADQRTEFAEFTEELLLRSPGHNERYFAMGRAYLDIALLVGDVPTLVPIRTKRLSKARAALSRYLEEAPECADGWEAFGHVCNLMRDKDAAKQACIKLTGLDEDKAQRLCYMVAEF